MTAEHSAADRPALEPDEQELLSEQLVEHLGRLDSQIAEQRATLLDSSGAARPQARRVLDRLTRWADAYLARLHRIRAGGPRCRRCGRPLTFEQLNQQILAVHCGRCGPATSGNHPSQAGRRRPIQSEGVTS